MQKSKEDMSTACMTLLYRLWMYIWQNFHVFRSAKNRQNALTEERSSNWDVLTPSFGQYLDFWLDGLINEITDILIKSAESMAVLVERSTYYCKTFFGEHRGWIQLSLRRPMKANQFEESFDTVT